MKEEMYDAVSIVSSIKKRIGILETSDFYVGITDNLARRLQEHNVAEQDCVAVLKAKNITEARTAERVLTAISGFKGGASGGNDDSIYVYCYRITKETVQ
ncbi:hypothetical protein [Parabacteroides distasonis]|jgi:hypothetical protein|uniref:hypothetical protein n=1 Tax=Parabacteroides distasonis TaxID=823 RepID=UPI0018A0E5A2|nr:hypothetical protein [Parabacteroides distasonis]MDB9153502.1 hypothetical protein [Parabacteroides distasonis]MDB9158074.1 hypothetical protein [Parabacteroides distasonis]MDB9166888.1 hypothetical protein [Parabacteroides distasonis]MDB9171358.1 hypothetical protein [Parabacteroides distasonis]MDB9192807.1 hypothetical protein [Parabacteroides distasonis]